MNYQIPSYAPINGLQVAYETVGDGFPLLMLHGFPRTRRSWQRISPYLKERFMIIAPDRRGYGDSDRGAPPESYNNAMLASEGIGMIDKLGIDTFMVVGHDKGMPTAARIAADNPDRVLGAVLLDGMPEGANVPRPPMHLSCKHGDTPPLTCGVRSSRTPRTMSMRNSPK